MYLFSSIFFFFPKEKGTVTATVPGDIAPQQPPGTWVPSPATRLLPGVVRAGAGTKELHKLSGLREPRSSPGGQAPCLVQCSGPREPDPVVSVPSLLLYRDSEVPQRIFPHHRLQEQRRTS